MKLIRTVHPIGQGGFYTEEFFDENEHSCKYRVVYDCGGKSESFIENYIESCIVPRRDEDKMKIDAIFISHLHSDHINGLQYLLENTDVKYLFLPQMDDDTKFEVMLHFELYSTSKTKKLQKFLINILNKEIKNTKIISVDFAADESSFDPDQGSDGIDLSSDLSTTNSINPGKHIILNEKNPWLYIPYNPPINKRGNSFSDFIKSKLNIKKLEPADIPDIINNNIAKIKSIYTEYFGSNHNSYSMTLFSGLKIPDCYSFKYNYNYYNHYRRADLCTPNCLYTGDFDVKFINGLNSFYDKLWETIRTIQVPHHGSINNYNDNLYKYLIKGFISAGLKNKYNHPHKDTLINILRNSCMPILVTEDFRSEYKETIIFNPYQKVIIS